MTNTKGNVNPLTLQPGGSTLRLVFADGTKQVQRSVKYPKKYIEKIIGTGAHLVEVYDVTDSKKKELIWEEGQ
jgi:hypothetical protein